MWCRITSGGDLENMEYPFIAIIPRSNITRSGRIPSLVQIDLFKNQLYKIEACAERKNFQETTRNNLNIKHTMNAISNLWAWNDPIRFDKPKIHLCHTMLFEHLSVKYKLRKLVVKIFTSVLNLILYEVPTFLNLCHTWVNLKFCLICKFEHSCRVWFDLKRNYK